MHRIASNNNFNLCFIQLSKYGYFVHSKKKSHAFFLKETTYSQKQPFKNKRVWLVYILQESGGYHHCQFTISIVNGYCLKYRKGKGLPTEEFSKANRHRNGKYLAPYTHKNSLSY